MSAVYAVSRISVAAIWIYHGLIPKCLFCHETELDLVELGPVIHSAKTTVMLAGGGEILLGCTVLYFWRSKWPMFFSGGAFFLLMLAALILKPALAIEAFNPVTLSFAAMSLAGINLLEEPPFSGPKLGETMQSGKSVSE